MEKMFTLKNGVEVFALEVENDFQEAQEILDLGSATENIDAEYAYEDRFDFEGLGSYKITVQRLEDFARFENMIAQEKNHFWKEIQAKKDNVYTFFREGKMSREEAIAYMDKLSNQYNEGCSCKVCKFNISFEEWKNGKMENGAKVGKSLKKAGFKQEIIDFYSAQVKTEKSVFLTISDRVQHIAGMSNYFAPNSTNFYGGTSCQDTRLDTSMSIGLGGSLHDDKLFIAMLHDSLEDLEDMTDKLKARVMMRYITLENGEAVLVPSKYYGNNETMSLLDNALGQLVEVGIFNRDVRDGLNAEYHREKANGYFYMNVYDEILISETIDEYVSCECPMCEGSGEYEVYSNAMDKHVEVECPLCKGNGEYEVNIYEDIEEWVEVEEETSVEPYVDDYNHLGYSISILVDKSKIMELMEATKQEA
jgi:hypothetical protein